MEFTVVYCGSSNLHRELTGSPHFLELSMALMARARISSSNISIWFSDNMASPPPAAPAGLACPPVPLDPPGAGAGGPDLLTTFLFCTAPPVAAPGAEPEGVAADGGKLALFTGTAGCFSSVVGAALYGLLISVFLAWVVLTTLREATSSGPANSAPRSSVGRDLSWTLLWVVASEGRTADWVSQTTTLVDCSLAGVSEAVAAAAGVVVGPTTCRLERLIFFLGGSPVEGVGTRPSTDLTAGCLETTVREPDAGALWDGALWVGAVGPDALWVCVVGAGAVGAGAGAGARVGARGAMGRVNLTPSDLVGTPFVLLAVEVVALLTSFAVVLLGGGTTGGFVGSAVFTPWSVTWVRFIFTPGFTLALGGTSTAGLSGAALVGVAKSAGFVKGTCFPFSQLLPTSSELLVLILPFLTSLLVASLGLAVLGCCPCFSFLSVDALLVGTAPVGANSWHCDVWSTNSCFLTWVDDIWVGALVFGLTSLILGGCSFKSPSFVFADDLFVRALCLTVLGVASCSFFSFFPVWAGTLSWDLAPLVWDGLLEADFDFLCLPFGGGTAGSGGSSMTSPSSGDPGAVAHSPSISACGK